MRGHLARNCPQKLVQSQGSGNAGPSQKSFSGSGRGGPRNRGRGRQCCRRPQSVGPFSTARIFCACFSVLVRTCCFPTTQSRKTSTADVEVRGFFRLLWWDTTTTRETMSVTTQVLFTQSAARARSMPAVETHESQERSQENQQEWRPVA